MICILVREWTRINELPPSSRRQADVHRTSAFRWVQVPQNKKKRTSENVRFFLVGEAGLEPARPQ